MLTDKAISYLPFPWSSGQSEWRKDFSEPTPGSHEYLMFLAFIFLEEQNLFIFDGLEGCLVAECCFINALPPRLSSRLPSLSSFLFLSSISFFKKDALEKVTVPFISPPYCEPAWLLLCQWKRTNGDVGKGSSGEGGQEKCAAKLRSSTEAERSCRQSQRRMAEQQVEAAEDGKEAAAGFWWRTGFSAPFRICHLRCTGVAVDGSLSSEGSLKKKVHQKRILPKLHFLFPLLGSCFRDIIILATSFYSKPSPVVLRPLSLSPPFSYNCNCMFEHLDGCRFSITAFEEPISYPQSKSMGRERWI